MGAGARRRSVALLVSVLLGRVPSARAASPGAGEFLDVEWDAPPECPTRDAVVAEITRLVGAIPAATARVSARVYLSRGEDSRWHVLIATLGDSGGERTLDAASCLALAEATALVLALRIKPSLVVDGTPPAPLRAPEPPVVPPNVFPTRPRPPPANDSSPRRVGVFVVGASIVGTAGELPFVDVRPELELGYRWRRLRLELHGEASFVQKTAATAADAGASFHAAGGGVRACYGPTVGALALFGCANGQLDWMWASGFGVATPLTANSGWVTVAAGVGASLKLARRFALRAFLEGLAPLTRPTFITENHEGTEAGVVHRPAAVWGRASLGAEVLFF